VVSVDALPAAMGGFVVFFALLGGAFGQLFKGGVISVNITPENTENYGESSVQTWVVSSTPSL
jgi:hypothetical protein